MSIITVATQGPQGPPGAPGAQGPAGTSASNSLTVYNAKDTYGAVGDGLTNDRAAIQSAITACAATGGIVYLPAGDYLLNGGGSVLGIPVNNAKRVTIRGAGRGATTIHLSANTYSAFGPGNYVDGSTWKNWTLEDFTVNCHNSNPGSNAGVLVAGFGSYNVTDWRVRRCDVVNSGFLSARRIIDIMIWQTAFQGTPQYQVLRGRIEQCEFGWDGSGGGATGVVIAGFTPAPVNAALLGETIYPQIAPANVWIDEIEIDGLKWDSGTIPTNGGTSAGVHMGSVGWLGRFRLTNSILKGSSDVGVEIDNVQDGLVENVTCIDNWSEGFLHTAFCGDSGPQAHLHFNKCRAINTGALSLNAPQTGFLVQDASGVQNQRVTMTECFAQNAQITIAGPIRAFTANACKVVYDNTYMYTVDNDRPYRSGMWLALWTGKGKVTVNDFVCVDRRTFANPSAHTNEVAAMNPGLSLQILGDYTVDVDGVTLTGAPIFTGATQTFYFLNAVGIGGGGGTPQQEPFSSDVRTTDFSYDAGVVSDLAVAGGHLTSIANHTVEKRLIWWRRSGQFGTGAVGPNTDGAFYVQGVPDAGALTGFKLGAGHRIDANNYLEAYLSDDGGSSFLNLDKVVAGVRTALSAPVALGSRMTAVNQFVRIKLRGNVITADYYTSAPANTATVGTTTMTTTLAATADISLFRTQPGHWLTTFTPQSVNAYIDLIQHDRMGVWRSATIRGVRLQDCRHLGFPSTGFAKTGTPGALRYEGGLTIRDCDFASATAALEGGGSFVDVASFDATFDLPLMRRENIAYGGAAPVPATITPGASPYIYTNQDGYAEDVAVYSGTVSVIEKSIDSGGTFGQIGSTTGQTVRLNSGDQLRITYSVVPTMRKVPVL